MRRQVLHSTCLTLSFTPDASPSQVKKREVIGCDWRPHNALPASVHSPPAVESRGGYRSHFQPLSLQPKSSGLWYVYSSSVWRDWQWRRVGVKKGKPIPPLLISRLNFYPPIPALNGLVQSKPPVWASPRVQPTMWILQRLQRSATQYRVWSETKNVGFSKASGGWFKGLKWFPLKYSVSEWTKRESKNNRPEEGKKKSHFSLLLML